MADYEARFRLALERIRAYDSIAYLRRNSERGYGLDYTEALEMAYENMQDESRVALRGVRKKRSGSATAVPAVESVVGTGN